VTSPVADPLDELVRLVRISDKYSQMDEALVRSLGLSELNKRNSLKEAVKATRNKLHQIGSAYQEKPIPYAAWKKQLTGLPHSLADETVQEFLSMNRQAHASTRERTSIEEIFFKQTLATLGPIHSVIDLACGLNPLNYSFMPLAEDCSYFACDIYQDMIQYLNLFFDHFSIQGKAEICDLVHHIPEQNAQVALLLKTIPCLEQIDKTAGQRLLDGLQAENILVSFPAHSLGGRSKGMVQNYEAHFSQLVAGKNWRITHFVFPGELAFLIQK